MRFNVPLFMNLLGAPASRWRVALHWKHQLAGETPAHPGSWFRRLVEESWKRAMNPKAGRVTPCAPLGVALVANGAHGVTRPTSPDWRGRGYNQLLCVFSLLSVLRSAVPLQAQTPSPHDYAAVDAIFSQHCLDCHAAQDAEGQFVLESFDSLMKGGEIGPAVVPGKSGESLLIKMIEGRFE